MDDPSLRSAARLELLDGKLNEIRGMSDQSGGARRKSRRSKKHGGARRKSRSSKKHGGARRKSRRSSKKQGGGAMPAMMPASSDSPGMLVDPKVTNPTMNPEWELAQDPKSFIPDAVRSSVAAV